jgi:TP901 family phage tail tape measure protein
MSQPLTVSVLLKLIDKMSDPLKVALSGSEKKLDSMGKKAESAGKKMESIGARIGGIGVAGQAGLSRLGLDLSSLVGKAFEAEKALFGIAATAGLSGREAQAMVGQWAIAVNQIAVATNQSQELVTAAFQDMIAKGLSPEQATAMLKPIGQAATAAGADIQDMASAAQASFSKLKIPVEDVAKSLDIMAAAGKAGAFELRDMAGFFDKLTASAANLGISGQEGLAGISAAAQIARRGTGDAASAATNLDNFLSKLNAGVTYKAFAEMGVDLGKLKEEAKASGDYIGFMGDAIQKLTGGDTAKVASLFNDIQAGAFVQGLLRDLEDYKQIRDDALAASGVAAQDFATAMMSAEAKIAAFKIGATAAVSNSEALKSLLVTLTSVATWANEHPEITKWLIFGTAGLAVGGAAVVGIGATITAIGGIATALSGLSVFLLANPVVAALVGAAAVGVAVYTYWDEIVAALESFWETVKSLFTQGVEYIKEVFLNWTPLGLVIKNFDAIVGAAKKGLDALKATVKGWAQVGANIMQGLIDGITAKYDYVVDKIKGLGGSMLAAIKGVLGIRSPSVEMELIGEYTVLGMLIGMENEEDALVRTAGDIGTAAMDALQKPFRDSKGRFLPADEAQRAASEWQTASDDIERSLTDALMRGFEGGKDWASNFVDTLKNMFSTLVLRPLIEPIAQGGASMTMGALGMGSSGASAGGLVSSGSSLLSTGGAAAGYMGSLGTMASYTGAALSGGAIAGATQGGMLAAQTASFGAFGASSTASALGGASAALAAVPVWGWVALAALAIFGLSGSKPSDKSGWSEVDLGSGESLGTGGLEGKKFSQENRDAAKAATDVGAAYAQMLTDLGATIGGALKIEIGDRDGMKADLDNDGAWDIVEKDQAVFFDRLFDALTESSVGLDAALKDMLVSFDGTTEEMLEFAGALVAIREYTSADLMTDALDQIEQAGRSTWQTWQAGNTELRELADNFDGSLASATDLANASANMYALELNLIGQIQGLLVSTNAMFGNSIEQIMLSNMDAAQQYDYWRAEVDRDYAALLAATDPAEIARLSGEINQGVNNSYGLLDEDQQAALAPEFIAYLEGADALTTERLNASQDAIVATHADLTTAIENVMTAVADKMMEAAELNFAAAQTSLAAAQTPVTLDSTSLDNPMYEVGG